MGFSDILKSLFGSKSDRDMKKLRPIVEKLKPGIWSAITPKNTLPFFELYNRKKT